MALVPAIALGIFVVAFVPMAAVFPALEPNHKGAAISVYNLSAGCRTFWRRRLPWYCCPISALSAW
ncbi:ribitol/Xylitol/Arabitol transporter, MFS superfamily [Klebsiella pneumoniae]|uniref:Ribitol/Xylitol/Arabitol transporter, MFS superfamily n=1 Tax=Klebsiella pneumoniae TaxID=573 RepID=A0A378FYG4_KLEPN|nr:ribitol/Xylitol/Arabitol transporter, MFS superfamily [Klebsiella pneumoniae]